MPHAGKDEMNFGIDPILIVGGGPVGLTLAWRLDQAGTGDRCVPLDLCHVNHGRPEGLSTSFRRRPRRRPDARHRHGDAGFGPDGAGTGLGTGYIVQSGTCLGRNRHRFDARAAQCGAVRLVGRNPLDGTLAGVVSRQIISTVSNDTGTGSEPIQVFLNGLWTHFSELLVFELFTHLRFGVHVAGTDDRLAFFADDIA